MQAYVIIGSLLATMGPVIYILVGLRSGAAKLNALSSYRAMQLAGVINEEALKAYRGGVYSHDWVDVPYVLIGGYSFVVPWSAFVAIVVSLLGVTLLVATYRHRRTSLGNGP